MIKICLTTLIVFLWQQILIQCVVIDNDKTGIIRLNLLRQKTPTEQFLNYGHEFGSVLKDLNGKRDNDSIALYRFLDEHQMKYQRRIDISNLYWEKGTFDLIFLMHEFYGKVVFGHPGQTLNVAFDTTWSFSWILSSKCNSKKTIGCWFHNKYDHSKSLEYKKDGRPFSLELGTFNMTGFYSYDNISIAHSNATTQSFIEMVEVPNSFVLNKASGVLGLGLKNSDYTPFFYTLLNQKKIKNPIFSIYLNRDTQSTRGGNVMLGFVDKRHIHSTKVKNVLVYDNITYFPVDGHLSYWQFNMDKVIVDIKNPANPNEKARILCKTGCKAIPDTSSNTIIGPKEDVDDLHDAIQASEFFLNRYTVDCDTVNKLPKIMFVLGGKNFTLTGPDYIVKMSYHSVTMCFSAFVPATTIQEANRWFLGGAFLAEYYSVYNVYDKTIGFVKAS